jgi:hypothetical protein
MMALEKEGVACAWWLPFEKSKQKVLNFFNASSLPDDPTNPMIIVSDVAKGGDDTSSYAWINVFAPFGSYEDV